MLTSGARPPRQVANGDCIVTHIAHHVFRSWCAPPPSSTPHLSLCRQVHGMPPQLLGGGRSGRPGHSAHVGRSGYGDSYPGSRPGNHTLPSPQVLVVNPAYSLGGTRHSPDARSASPPSPSSPPMARSWTVVPPSGTGFNAVIAQEGPGRRRLRLLRVTEGEGTWLRGRGGAGAGGSVGDGGSAVSSGLQRYFPRGAGTGRQPHTAIPPSYRGSATMDTVRPEGEPVSSQVTRWNGWGVCTCAVGVSTEGLYVCWLCGLRRSRCGLRWLPTRGALPLRPRW
jgi:hypothetical protein